MTVAGPEVKNMWSEKLQYCDDSITRTLLRARNIFLTKRCCQSCFSSVWVIYGIWHYGLIFFCLILWQEKSIHIVLEYCGGGTMQDIVKSARVRKIHYPEEKASSKCWNNYR